MKSLAISIAKKILANCAAARYLYFLVVDWRFFSNLKKQIAHSEGKTRAVLEAIRDEGVYVETGFWSEDKVAHYLTSLKQTYLNQQQDFRADPHIYLGSSRYYHVERDIESLRADFKENKLLDDVAKRFYGFNPSQRKLMYQHSTFSPAVAQHYNKDLWTDAGPTPIAPRFHFDFMKRTIKAVVYLNSVGLEQGPTEFCFKKSVGTNWRVLWSRLHKQSKYLKARLVGGNNQQDTIWTHQEAKSLGFESTARPLTGTPGTLAIFDTFTVHRASELMSGERHVLWYYFDP